MKQGIYFPPDANEALRKTQSWQTCVLGLVFLLTLELLMADKAIRLTIALLFDLTHACHKNPRVN